MKVILVYDDTGRKSEVIADIIGDKGFSEVVVKKRQLGEYYFDELSKIYPELIIKKLHSVFEYPELLKELGTLNAPGVRVLHCFSNYLITDAKSAALSFKKLEYIEEPFAAMDAKKAVAGFFPDADSYITFIHNVMAGQKAWDIVCELPESFPIDGLVDIGLTSNFIQCITGNFDSRYYNSLEGNEYTLVKTSTNKNKIKAEYTFYHLLPEDMKYWFVLPFDYKETKEGASYTMERLHMADLAIKWVHGSMGKKEFSELLDKYFYFFKSRHEQSCTENEMKAKAEALYTDKVKQRLKALKGCSEYAQIEAMLKAAKGPDLDELADKYFTLKKKIEKNAKRVNKLVIGHGDPCFANTLYNKSTKTLKFIDPKGALTEEELWTDSYYDVAKLSHSICGLYDFFNNGLFDIRINEKFAYELDIPFDNTDYVAIFREKAEENGFDFSLIRLYEASLFLSMLPLHIDNPQKVFAFILRIARILDEI